MNEPDDSVLMDEGEPPRDLEVDGPDVVQEEVEDLIQMIADRAKEEGWKLKYDVAGYCWHDENEVVARKMVTDLTDFSDRSINKIINRAVRRYRWMTED